MANFIKDFIEIDKGYDFLDTLETYESIFNELGINLYEYEEEFDYNSTTYYEDLDTVCKKILLIEAKLNDIIPEGWDIDEKFEYNSGFYIIDNTDEAKDIQDSFKAWAGITLGINGSY